MRLNILVPTFLAGAVLVGGCGEEKSKQIKGRDKTHSHDPALEPDPEAARLVDCSALPAASIITIHNRRLSENPAHVTAGQVIKWENHDSLDHSVTSGQPKDDNAGELFDSGLLTKGEAVCVQFNKPGYFHYFCTGHSDGNGGGVDVTKE